MAITVNWYDTRFEAAYAVRKGDEIILYDEDYNVTNHIFHLTYRDEPYISIDGGTWTDISEIPTTEDRLQADIDYLNMQAEALEESGEANRADIDYCLMMLNDGAVE